MSTADFDARTGLSSALRRGKARVAERATESFLANHPDLLARLGERARHLGREDAGYHIDFLAGAVDSGMPAAFGDYIRWVVRVLTPRGLPASMVRETLLAIEEGFRDLLPLASQDTLGPFIAEGLCGCDAPPATATSSPITALTNTQSIFLQSLLAADRRAATTIATAALAEGHELMAIYVEVLQASLYDLGRLWESNRITVAEEHAGTAVCQYVLAELYARMPAPGRRRGRAVMTGVEGEFHQMGANLVADAWEADGWAVRFLGTNTPRAGVLQALDVHDADVLGISVTMLFNVSLARLLVREARAQRPALSVLVGGAAFRVAPHLWREIGADAQADDVRGAVEVLREDRHAGDDR
jgi:methanogenic corrinoid protein MtbC1